MLNDPNGQDWDDWKKDWPMPSDAPTSPPDDEPLDEPIDIMIDPEYGVISCPGCHRTDAVMSRYDQYHRLFKCRCHRCGMSFNTGGVR